MLYKWLAFKDEPIDNERLKLAKAQNLEIYPFNKTACAFFVVGSACKLSKLLGLTLKQFKEIASKPMTTITKY